MADGQKFGGLDALTADDVSDLLGVTPKTVRNWMNREGLESVHDGRRRVLPWFQTLEWYVQRRIKDAGTDGNRQPENPTNAETLDEAETRKTIADADLKELKLAQLRQQLVPADEVGRNVGKVAAAIKTKLDSMPNALALRLVGKSDRVEIQQILQDAVFRIKLELSEVGRQIDESSPSAGEDDDE